MAKRGYKQTSEHIAKRIKSGPNHPNWIGDKVSVRGGRTRALRTYKPQLCEHCGRNAERHHKDGDTANNDPSNIEFLCRRCHMQSDGRLDAFRNMERSRGKDGRYASR